LQHVARRVSRLLSGARALVLDDMEQVLAPAEFVWLNDMVNRALEASMIAHEPLRSMGFENRKFHGDEGASVVDSHLDANGACSKPEEPHGKAPAEEQEGYSSGGDEAWADAQEHQDGSDLDEQDFFSAEDGEGRQDQDHPTASH
jgi:hypothetical protein